VVLAILIASCVYTRRRRISPSSSASSTQSKKSWFSRIRSGSNRGEYSSHLQPIPSHTGDGDSLTQSRSQESRVRDVEMELVTEAGAQSTRGRNTNTTNAATATNNAANADTGVDRHASVRSVMTLPPYSIAPRPTEQVLGREGERAGIDLVIEQPETVDEEEERREEEMESLFQIRQARRQEAQDREERRRQRREARQRGDIEALNRLQRESRQRAQRQQSGQNASTQLIADHQGRNRDRRVSSVQYQDIGIARHDGSRVRATSFEGDDRPLLSSAASINGAGGSRQSLGLHQHGRDRSTVSFQSVSSIGSRQSSDDGTDPNRSTSRIGQDFEVISLDPDVPSRSRASSTAAPLTTSTSHASSTIPPTEPPPNYDDGQWGDAPPYESPVTRTNPEFPRNTSVPAITVSRSRTPASSPRP
jgi:hypothetical protein